MLSVQQVWTEQVHANPTQQTYENAPHTLPHDESGQSAYALFQSSCRIAHLLFQGLKYGIINMSCVANNDTVLKTLLFLQPCKVVIRNS